MEEEDPYSPDVLSKSSKSEASLSRSDDNTKWPSAELGSI